MNAPPNAQMRTAPPGEGAAAKDKDHSDRHQDKPLLAEWQGELQRRLARARVLVSLGLPDPGFDLLAYEIMRLRAVASSMRRAS